MQKELEQCEDIDRAESGMSVKPAVLSGLMLDKVYLSLLESCLILEDFTQLPSIRQHTG